MVAGLLLSATALAQPARVPGPKTPIPVAVFAQFPAMSGADISADGKMIAAKFRSGGEKGLGIIDLQKPGSKPELVARDGDFMGYGDRRVLGWNWFDGENLLIQLAEYTDVEGQKLDEATIAKIAAIARDEVKPIDDVRATAWYRKEMIHNITKRILSHVAQA